MSKHVSSDSSPQDSLTHVYPMRLQKYLRSCGVASRRGSEDLMTAGRVTVNGEVVTQLGSKVDPLVDVVQVDGRVVTWGAEPVYLMLNKPTGYLTTMKDPQGRPCVADLVPTQDYPGLYAVGRLDNMTSGLLLFTTDGELGHGLLHPSHHVDKTYLAQVSGVPTEKQLESLRQGIELDDGRTAPAEVQTEGQVGSNAVLRITIHEGRNRQVRRMCSAIGHECLELQRVSFGPLQLEGVEEGAWRFLSLDEVQAICRAAGKAC